MGGCYSGTDGDANEGGGSEDADGDGDGDDDDDDGPANQVCDPDGPSATPLMRLSAQQYRNTLADLFASAPAALPEIESALVDLPLDEAEGDAAYGGMDLRLTQRHVNTFYAVANVVADTTLDDSSTMSAMAGDCALAPNVDEACLESFVTDMGLRIHRRPLSEEDVALYMGLIDPERTGPETYRDVLFSMLMSPAFLYHFETEGDGEGIQELDDYEIASRLSFHFWQTMPDEELFAAAAAGELTTEEGYLDAVDRMVRGDGQLRTEETVRRFYREWLHLDGVAGFVDTPAFNAFAEGAGADDSLLTAMQEEIDLLTHYYTWETDGQFADLITSNRSFTSDPTLAALYGVPTADGSEVTFPDGERAGILTRSAMLISGDEKTNPIFRGMDVRERLLCLGLAPPDPADVPPDAFDPPPLDPEQTTRERYEAKTSPTECTACHSQINPIGYVQEAYDGLGRYRTTELIYDDSGNLIGEQPVNTAVSIEGLDSETLDFSGPVDMMEWLADDPRVQACFAKQYFEFTFRRHPSPNDACVVENLEVTLREESIVDALEAIALQPEFRLRTVEE